MERVMADMWLVKELLEPERRCRALRGITRNSSRYLGCCFCCFAQRSRQGQKGSQVKSKA